MTARGSFPCPKCRNPQSSVVLTRHTEHGESVRRRSCEECGHKWFTMQEPEFLLSRDAVRWSGNQLRLTQEVA